MIIQQAKTGDQRAFEALYNANKASMYRLCFRMTNNPAEAEDLTQEAFLQLYRKLHQFQGESAFSTYLYRITVNTVLMYHRKKKLNQISLDEVFETDKGKRKIDVGSIDPGLMLSPERTAFWEAFDALPHGYRLIFFLHDLQGYEHIEIANMLDCTVGNAKSQLHKARVKLLTILNPGRTPFDFESILHGADLPPSPDLFPGTL